MQLAPQDQNDFERRVHDSLAFANGPDQDGTINSALGLQFEACSLEQRSLLLSVEIKPWMYNPTATTIHGGVSAALADHALGTLAFCLNDCRFTPTVDLNISYLRPVRLDQRLFIQAQLRSNGRHLAMAQATAWSESQSQMQPAYVANGTFYISR